MKTYKQIMEEIVKELTYSRSLADLSQGSVMKSFFESQAEELIKANLLRFLSKLGIRSASTMPPLPLEMLIQRSISGFGQPDTVLMSSKALAEFMKVFGGSK